MMMDWDARALSGFWVAFIACSVMTMDAVRAVVPAWVRGVVRRVAARGKDEVDDDDEGGGGGGGGGRRGSKASSSSSSSKMEVIVRVVKAVLTLRVPHRWFQHFYVVGAGVNARTLYVALARASSVKAHNVYYVVYALVLFQVHLFRRLYESVFVSVYSSEARMHVAAYALGLAYYACASQSWASAASPPPPTTMSRGAKDMTLDQTFEFEGAIPQLACVALAVVGTALFIVGNVNQYRCHVILANLRRGKRSRDAPTVRSYAIPRGGWFERFSCAHYTAEIVLYIGLLAIVVPSRVHARLDADAFARVRAPILLVCAVIANLAVAARAHHAWYIEHFPRTYPRHRTALFPSFTSV